MANHWDPEYVISSDKALRIINTQFPELNANSIEFLGAGNDNTAFIVNNTYVFRFPRKTESILLLQDELYILPKITAYLPYSIPIPQWVGKPQDNYPWIFAGYTMLTGKSACQLNLSATERATFAKPLAHFLSKLHSIPILEHKNHLPDETQAKLNSAIIIPKIEKNILIMESYALLKNNSLLYQVLETLKDITCPQNRSLVHGDLYVRHLLVDENSQLTSIIDWGDVHIGNPAIDLSIAYTFLPPQAHQEFKDAYGTISDETWLLAKLRALYLATVFIVRGQAVKDSIMIEEGLKTLNYMTNPFQLHSLLNA